MRFSKPASAAGPGLQAHQLSVAKAGQTVLVALADHVGPLAGVQGRPLKFVAEKQFPGQGALLLLAAAAAICVAGLGDAGLAAAVAGLGDAGLDAAVADI